MSELPFSKRNFSRNSKFSTLGDIEFRELHGERVFHEAFGQKPIDAGAQEQKDGPLGGGRH
jgi:hypothetical protein